MWEEFKVKERIRVRQYRTNRKNCRDKYRHLPSQHTIPVKAIFFQIQEKSSDDFAKITQEKKGSDSCFRKGRRPSNGYPKKCNSKSWAFQRRHRTHPPVLWPWWYNGSRSWKKGCCSDTESQKWCEEQVCPAVTFNRSILKSLTNCPRQYVCACKFLTTLPVVSAYTQLPKNVSDFTDNLVCNPSSKTCMSLECTECRDKIREYQPQLDIKNVNIT